MISHQNKIMLNNIIKVLQIYGVHFLNNSDKAIGLTLYPLRSKAKPSALVLIRLCKIEACPGYLSCPSGIGHNFSTSSIA